MKGLPEAFDALQEFSRLVGTLLGRGVSVNSFHQVAATETGLRIWGIAFRNCELNGMIEQCPSWKLDPSGILRTISSPYVRFGSLGVR